MTKLCPRGKAAAKRKFKVYPSEEDIEITMRGNLCRCMTYQRIKDAIKKAGKTMRERNV